MQPVYNSNNGADNITRPRRIPLVTTSSASSPATVATTTTTIPLYRTDTLRSPPRYHSHPPQSVTRHPADGRRLENTQNYPIRQGSGAPAGLYNAVEIIVVIHDA